MPSALASVEPRVLLHHTYWMFHELDVGSRREENYMKENRKIKVSAIASCYQGEKYLPAFLENCAEQTISGQIEIVLIHNDPSDNELGIVRQFQKKYPDLINHIVVPREPLAVSTNRAIQAASGEYLCIWNIDDLRTADSLELMMQTLDGNPDVGFSYGDYIAVSEWEGKEGQFVSAPEFEKQAFISCMLSGPFYMWRTGLCQTLGVWDEQFKCAADFDYAARLAVECTGMKAPGLLGWYLNAGLGLSTSGSPWQAIERTVVELRFRVCLKIDLQYVSQARKYRISHVLQNGAWVPIEQLMPHGKDFEKSKWGIFYTVSRHLFRTIKRALHLTEE